MTKLALALALCVAPTLALACPACARDDTPQLALWLGGMIAVPYVIVALVLLAIRGGLR